MVKYKKTFLDIIKAFFSYIIEYNKNESILSKDYSKNYIINNLNKRLIIIITYNKNTFLTNDS